jgi:hypothetical protein
VKDWPDSSNREEDIAVVTQFKKVDMREYLSAIDELIEHYKMFVGGGKVNLLRPCPLCQQSRVIVGFPYLRSHQFCLEGKCPWLVYEGMVCKMDDQTPVRAIARLKRWRERIVEEFGEGKG